MALTRLAGCVLVTRVKRAESVGVALRFRIVRPELSRDAVARRRRDIGGFVARRFHVASRRVAARAANGWQQLLRAVTLSRARSETLCAYLVALSRSRSRSET